MIVDQAFFLVVVGFVIYLFFVRLSLGLYRGGGV